MDRQSFPRITAATRVHPRYVNYGMVIEHSRLYRVELPEVAGIAPAEQLGFMLVYLSDPPTIYVTPDLDGSIPYNQRRWVGGFNNRMEAVWYLRGHWDQHQAWWVEAGEEMQR